MVKVLLTGAGGMLGKSVYFSLKEKGYDLLATDIDLNENWLNYLDVRDYTESGKIITSFKPEIVIHLAALTNIEYCEENALNAWETNYLGTKNIAKICNENDAILVYVSTAGVFDGLKEQYTEEDIPNPVNIYGKTKLYGEIAVENILKKYFIVRAGWMVGGGSKDKKFVSYILSQIKEGLKIFNVVNDTKGTITYTKYFANNLEILFKTKNYGLYHMVCEGKTNRVLIAKKIVELIGLKDGRIKEVSSVFFKKQFPIPRAPCEQLVNQNLTKLGINKMKPWDIALKDYLEDEWKELIIKT